MVQIFKTVEIDGQVWLAENLNYEIKGSDCYDEDPVKCEQYGRLYTWEAAKKAAEMIPGWKLPTDQDWIKLETFLQIRSTDNKFF